MDGDNQRSEVGEFDSSQENPTQLDGHISQEPAPLVTNEPELGDPYPSPEDTRTDPSYEASLNRIMNDIVPLVSYDTQIAAPIFGVVAPITHVQVEILNEHKPLDIGSAFYLAGSSVPLGFIEGITDGFEHQRYYTVRLNAPSNLVLGNSPVMQVSSCRDTIRLQKDTGKRKADRDENAINKKPHTTTLVGSSSNPPVSQGFAAGSFIGAGGSSVAVQTVQENRQRSVQRLLHRQGLNQMQQQQNTTMVVRGSSNLPNSAGGAGSSGNAQPFHAIVHQAQQQFFECWTAQINPNPVQAPDVPPQPFYQVEMQQGTEGRGQGGPNRGRGEGDPNRGRGRGRGLAFGRRGQDQ